MKDTARSIREQRFHNNEINPPARPDELATNLTLHRYNAMDTKEYDNQQLTNERRADNSLSFSAVLTALDREMVARESKRLRWITSRAGLG